MYGLKTVQVLGILQSFVRVLCFHFWPVPFKSILGARVQGLGVEGFLGDLSRV